MSQRDDATHGELPAEVLDAYAKANEAACCGCSRTVQHGPDDMEQVCCGSPVPLALIDEAVARDLGVAVYKHWQELFARSETVTPDFAAYWRDASDGLGGESRNGEHEMLRAWSEDAFRAARKSAPSATRPRESLRMHPEVVERVLKLADISYKDFTADDIRMLMGFCVLHASDTYLRDARPA